MAQLKDLIVNGPSRFIGDVYATTFTGNLAGNASTATSATTAAALTGKTLVTASSVTTSNWSTYGNNHIPTMSFMAYWNGAYSDTSSNLTYCKQGTIIGSNNIGSQSVSYATTSGSCSGNAASSIQSLLLSSTSDAKGALGVYFHRDLSVTSLVGNTEGNGVWGHPSDSQDARYGNASILRIGWDSKYYTDIFTGPNIASGKYGLQWRQIVNGTANDWKMLLDSSNYNYYALPLSGGTMSNTNVVTNLNADLLDGLHASSFSLAEHTHSQYLTSALIPAKLARKETYPPGYFIIKINNNNSEWMLSFDVKIVVTDGSYTIRFSEDNRSMSKSWSSPSASMIDGEDSVEVKFGYSQTNKWVAILIPESYAGISITNVANGYAPIDTYALNKLFSINFYMGDVLQYLGTVQKTITIYPPSKEGHTHTFASITSKPTTISGYGITDALTTSNYNSYALSLSGGTLTGSVVFTNGATNIYTSNTTSNWIYISKLYTGSTASSTTYQASIGWHNTGGKGNGALTLIPFAQNSEPWGGSVGLYISQTSLRFNGTEVSLNGHTHNYLPLSGGTMSNTNLVTNLNADLLDGYHASSFAKVASHNNLMSSSNEFTFASSAYAGEIFINHRTAGGYNGAITKYSFYNGAGGLLASISQGQFSGNAATATNADKLGGVHYQNILERQNSGYSTSGTATGWFRIAETLTDPGFGITFLLAIQRNYWYVNNESYLFSITISYNGGISITQLSGYANNRLITKIRVDWANSRNAYVDLYINSSSTNNRYYWYTVGCAKSYTAWTANPTLAGTAYEFTTVDGCKSDRGFTANGQICINTSSSQTNNYNEGIRCNLGGSSSWASVVLGGASGSTTGTGSGIYSLLVNSSLFRIRQNSTDVLCINTSNNVGIGTTSPSYKLHVVGTAYASAGLVSDGPVKVNESFVVDGTNGSWYGKLNIADEVYILGEDTNINFIESLNIKQHNTTDNTETSIVSIDKSGNITLNVMNDNGGSYEISTRLGSLGIGIPSNDPNLIKTPSFLMSNQGYIYLNARVPSSPKYPLVVNGTIECTKLSQTSDIKYKSNIKQIEYEEALKIIENLNPVTWDWNENTVETGSSSGFVAQEAEEFIPNAISRDNENNLSLDYTQLHSYEIRVIQEQQKEIIKLKEKLKILENLIS